jgi:Fe-S cluster assembly protein SufD
MSSLSTTTNYLTPSGREEAWRFTPLSRLAGLLNADVPLAQVQSFAIGAAHAGVTLESKDSAPYSQTVDSATIRARAAVTQAQYLTIAANAEVNEPIILTRIGLTGEAPQATRLQIHVGANAHAKILLQNTGEAIVAEEIEFKLEQGSSLHFISVQEWGTKAVQLGRHHAIIGKDATFTSTVVTIGGSLVRLLPTVEYAGQGSFADLSGVYFATDGQHLEHRIHVDHNVPNAKSRVNYKGALAGDKARTVWIGDVYIRAEAEGTDTYELNRNLLLSDGARADSVPNLEIETGEIVGAGHASTTGRFDDEQLFYLESRGIPAEIARRLVIRGFFSEIVSLIKIEEVEERIMAKIDSELDKVGK